MVDSARRQPVGPSIRFDVALIRSVTLALAAGAVTLRRGFIEPPVPTDLLSIIEVLCIALYLADVWIGRRLGRLVLADQPPRYGEGALGSLAAVGMFVGPWWLFELALVCLLLLNLWRVNVALSRRLRKPGSLLPLSFVFLIMIGTVLIKLPLSLAPGRELGWIDALFTMTSAVCVTGLIVVDTGSHFSPFGQFIIALFIQLGGLGIIIFGSMLAVLLGSRMSLREGRNLADALNEQPVSRVRMLAGFIVVTTLLFEGIGAAAMYNMWPADYTPHQRLGASLFHAVSAYCNAGFTLMPDNLMSYRYTALAHGVIVPLLVLGGIGYPVVDNVFQIIRFRISRKQCAMQGMTIAQCRLTLHSKIVLITTAGLYLYGIAVLAAGRLMPHVTDAAGLNVTANRTDPGGLGLRQLGAVLADSSFMSLTARTAGFNTVPMETLSSAEQFGLMTLMMIGGSPGGTAGGMRTTTLALMVLAAAATIRRRDYPEVFGRRIAPTIMQKAATIGACYVGFVSLITLGLCLVEPFPFIKLAFEAVSATTVTGLSMGITAELTTFGKSLIMVAMFVGRVGPLALLAVLAFGATPKRQYTYAREDVLIG